MINWEKLSFLPAQKIREIQNRQLRKFIAAKVYPFSPRYRTLFDDNKIKPEQIRTVEDLRHIPFTRKEDFLPTPENPGRFIDFVLQPDEALIKKKLPKGELFYLASLMLLRGKNYLQRRLNKEYRPIFLTATTGTTQQSVSFLYSHYDMKNLRVYGYRLIDVFAGAEEVRGVNLFPYAPHLAFWQTVFAGLAHDNFILSTGGGKVMSTQGNIEAILKVKPSVIIGVPSYVYHLVRTASEMGKEFSFLNKVVLGASTVPLGLKEKLADLLHGMGARQLHILGTYGFTEAKCAWGECPTGVGVSSGYHTYPDKEIFEVIDPETGEVKKEGEDGELVYSNIDARGSSVLRFRTGDLVKGGIHYEPCPYCKRTVPRISSDISRAHYIQSLQLSKVKGTLVDLNSFGALLEADKNVEEWQVEIRKKNGDPFEVDELGVYLSLKAGADPENLKNKLKEKIRFALEVTPNEILILSRKEMLERVEMEVSQKAKRLVDKRPKE